jgi:hypothetical protein
MTTIFEKTSRMSGAIKLHVVVGCALVVGLFFLGQALSTAGQALAASTAMGFATIVFTAVVGALSFHTLTR